MACVWRKAVLDSSFTAQRCCLFVQRRHRYKKKWAVNLPSKPPTQLALEHFDAFYRPLFGRQWPAVRVALLSLPKYAAVINSASDSDSSVERLTELGAVDLIQQAAASIRKQRQQPKSSVRSRSEESDVASVTNLTTTAARRSAETSERDDEAFLSEEAARTVEDSQSLETTRSEFRVRQNLETESDERVSPAFSASSTESQTQEEETTLRSESEFLKKSEERNRNLNLDPTRASYILSTNYNDDDKPAATTDDMENLLMPDVMSKQGQGEDSTNLEYFMPTEMAVSEKEELLREEWTRSMYQERPVAVSILEGQPLPSLLTTAASSSFSPLRVMVFPAGDVSDFPKPRADQSGLLNYYLLDAASILPVLALDVRPNDLVLDLCAAPGGKTLALLQILMSQGGYLHSNDVSRSRVKRLKTVLRSYLPADLQEEIITTSEKSGLTFREPMFNKVLVDVPCNSDRHVLVEDDNNLFKPGRINQRLQITTQQKDLLIAGLKSVKPGGSVVYSTCTLAAVQNQGVVQAAVEELWETTDMEVAVEDLTPLRAALSSFFTFHHTPNNNNNNTMGLLVLPSLLNNFGPSYCCKLRRLK